MSARHRNPPETLEGAAWELFMEIRRLEETDDQAGGNNEPLRAGRLDLYAQCLMTARGERLRPGDGATLN